MSHDHIYLAVSEQVLCSVCSVTVLGILYSPRQRKNETPPLFTICKYHLQHPRAAKLENKIMKWKVKSEALDIASINER